MSEFTVFPAIDLRHGRCVRLRQGRSDAETAYSDRPAEVARRWQDEGARWLHVVNLDGALESPETWSGPNAEALRAILAVARVPVQFGGGIRGLDSARRLTDMGVSRIIMGTIAVSRPEIVGEAIGALGEERVVVSLDARAGLVATDGWVSTSGIPVADLGLRLRDLGLRTVVHTDIARDGMLAGANVGASAELASCTGLSVIVSGGVAGLGDVRAAAQLAPAGIAGIIIGQALYSAAVSLPDALRAAEEAGEGAVQC